jgi:hypothetical protein
MCNDSVKGKVTAHTQKITVFCLGKGFWEYPEERVDI